MEQLILGIAIGIFIAILLAFISIKILEWLFPLPEYGLRGIMFPDIEVKK